MLVFLWCIIPGIYCLQYTYINHEEENLPRERVNTFTSRIIDPRNVPHLVYTDKKSLSECLLDFCDNQNPCYIQVEYKNSSYVCTLFTELLSSMGALVPSYDVSGIIQAWVFTKEPITCSGYCTHLGSNYLCGKDCQCPSYYPFYCKCNIGEKPVLKSCTALINAGYNVSGLYNIQPNPNHDSIEVFCDLSNKEGRILFFQRFDIEPSSHVFNRVDYTKSFGQPDSAYFLGLENIHHITQHIMVAVKTKAYTNYNKWTYNSYELIKVDNSEANYQVHLTAYSGDPDFSPFTYNNCNFHFDTPHLSSSDRKAGWWVYSGAYHKPTSPDGIYRHVLWGERATSMQKIQVWLVEKL